MKRVPGRTDSLALALLVSAAVCMSCYQRNHTQDEGTYQFTADEIIRDECAIYSGSTALWSGAMQIYGDLLRIKMDDRLYGIEAVVREIRHPPEEPLGMRRLPLARGVEGSLPENLLSSALGPETFRVSARFVI